MGRTDHDLNDVQRPDLASPTAVRSVVVIEVWHQPDTNPFRWDWASLVSACDAEPTTDEADLCIVDNEALAE